jgi:hypothetical protein
MPSYPVCFMNESFEKQYVVPYCQRSVIIRLALNGGRTIEVGKRQFAELEAFEAGKLMPCDRGRSDRPRD